MQEEKLWLLVSLKLSGEASPEELNALHTLLQEHPELGLKVETLQHIWREKHAGLNRNKEDAFNKHLQRLSNHYAKDVLQYDQEEKTPVIPLRNKVRILKMAIAIAASVVVCILVYDNYRGHEIKKPVQVPALAYNTISTKPGSKSKVQLPDGTQVWLNADSKITYNENFAGALREVQLSGEAYFDVVKDKAHPFIIHTASMDLKVLGTAFNVRSYANEKKTETSLIHGSIEVTLLNSPDKKITLKPNEKLIIQNAVMTVSQNKNDAATKTEEEDQPIMVLSKVHFHEIDSSATETLWVKNKLAFDSESLENVALKIERWYGVHVIIADEKLKTSEYSGVFEDETLQQVMEALKLTGNFRYVINRKEITIKQ